MQIQCKSKQNAHYILQRNREEDILKFIPNHKRPSESQSNPEQEEQFWRDYSRFQGFLYRHIAKRTAWYWHKGRHGDQRNKVWEPVFNVHNQKHLNHFSAITKPLLGEKTSSANGARKSNVHA